MELNRRQTECLHMLEDEYKKLDDDHHRLQTQCEDIQKKRLAYVQRAAIQSSCVRVVLGSKMSSRAVHVT